MAADDWTPARLLHVSNAYWSACALHAAVTLDLFTPLTACPHSATALAELLNADERGVAMLLTAMAALGLVDRQDDSYGATAFAAEYLSRTSPRYLGYIIRHHRQLVEPWSRLDRAVATGRPQRTPLSAAGEDEVRESFAMGMFTLGMLAGPDIAGRINLGGRQRLLDLGGGPGAYAIHFCRANPGLAAVIFDLPSTRPFAEDVIRRFGLADRITFHAGDYLTDELPGAFDAAWLSHILHAEGPEECLVILKEVVASLVPGGLILVQEFIMDDTLDGPLSPALFALNMLVNTERGRTYSESRLKELLAAAGAGNLRRLPIQLPNGAGIIAADIP